MTISYIIAILFTLVSTTAFCDELFNKSYAVVIGVSSYKSYDKWEKLDNAENDAKAIDKFLDDQGFDVKLLIGKEATRDSIIAYLEDTLAPLLTHGDRFVFYFSGHGKTLLRGGSDWGYLIPYDGDAEKSSTWIDMKQLRDLADKFGNARHQLFILDACFGGLFATKGSKASIPEDTPSYIAEITSRPARQYLTAGGTDEEAPAHSNLDGYREYSHYTAYLLKGLREGAADTYPDGFITASELDAYLGPAATTEHNKPRGGHFPGHEQGNFVFRSPKPAKIDTNAQKPTGPMKGGNDAKDEDMHDWERLSKIGNEGLKSYLTLHPNGQWAEDARARMQGVEPAPSASESPRTNTTLSKDEQDQIDDEWQKIKGAASSHTIELFLKRHPVGSHVPAAQRKLEELRAHGR